MAFYLTLAQHHPYLNGKKALSDDNDISTSYRNNFVESLTYIDGFLKELVDQYKQVGLYENTLFIIIGDHGEAFGFQHPPRFNNNILYREGLWVPLVIVNASLFPNLVEFDQKNSLIDVAPTIEYMLGMSPSNKYRGLPAFNSSQDRSTYAACWYKNRCLAVMNKNYKFIYNYGDIPDELYDMKTDLNEQNNIARDLPELRDQYRKEVFRWYSDVMLSYDNFYKSIDENYLSKASSYYQFPRDFYLFKKQVKKSEIQN